MVGNGNNADDIALQAVNQGIGEAMKRKRSRLVRAAFAHRRKLLQQVERPFDFVDEVVRCNQRAFADILVNGGIGISLRFFVKTDLRHLLRQGLLCVAGS